MRSGTSGTPRRPTTTTPSASTGAPAARTDLQPLRRHPPMPPRNPFPATDDGLWYQPPLGIAATDTPAMIGAGLGGTLYTPSIEVELSRKLRAAAAMGA